MIFLKVFYETEVFWLLVEIIVEWLPVWQKILWVHFWSGPCGILSGVATKRLPMWHIIWGCDRTHYIWLSTYAYEHSDSSVITWSVNWEDLCIASGPRVAPVGNYLTSESITLWKNKILVSNIWYLICIFYLLCSEGFLIYSVWFSFLKDFRFDLVSERFLIWLCFDSVSERFLIWFSFWKISDILWFDKVLVRFIRSVFERYNILMILYSVWFWYFC